MSIPWDDGGQKPNYLATIIINSFKNRLRMRMIECAVIDKGCDVLIVKGFVVSRNYRNTSQPTQRRIDKAHQAIASLSKHG